MRRIADRFNYDRLVKAVVLTAVALLMACGDGPTMPAPGSEPLLLAAAPEDGRLYLSWNRVSGADRYEISTLPHSTTQSVLQAAGPVIRAAVPALANGTLYRVQVSAMSGEARLTTSNVAVGVPRARPDCTWSRYVPWDPRQSAFCSYEAMDAWLAANGVSPLSLRCRGAIVAQWDIAAPDCVYQTQAGDQLLLMRSADEVFTPDRGYRDPNVVRHVARRLFWPGGDPFSSSRPLDRIAIASTPGQVKNHASVTSYRVQITAGLASRVTWFKPQAPVAGRYAIYHEGHGSPGVEIGAETIDWLLARGWEVIALDLPLNGLNYTDVRPGLALHWDFQQFEDGGGNPVTYFFDPTKDVVDKIIADNAAANVEILLIGRSGGGWLSYAYGALDPRIDAVVSIAGGTPLSQRLGATWIGIGLEALELGDYEQVFPDVYSVVRHEDLMLAAGTRGFLAIFNQYDRCCFRVNPGSEFGAWLVQGGVSGKRIEFFLDPINEMHSISAAGYEALDSFLRATIPLRQ